jgi:hypothetical protein
MHEPWKGITDQEREKIHTTSLLVRAGVESEVTKAEQLLLSYFFASLAFEDKSDDDKKWLKWRFGMLNEIIRETTAYKDILEEGAVIALRQAIGDVVQERFPEIIVLVNKHLEAIFDPSVLRKVNLKMCTVLEVEEVERYLETMGTE